MKLLFTLVLTLLSLPLLSQDFAGTSGDDVLVESSDDGAFSVDKGTVVEGGGPQMISFSLKAADEGRSKFSVGERFKFEMSAADTASNGLGHKSAVESVDAASTTHDVVVVGAGVVVVTGGALVVADVIPPDVSPLTDASQLLGFAWRGGFLGAALAGLVRTAFSDYRKLRAQYGLSTYRAEEIAGMLPARLGARVENSPRAMRLLTKLFDRGRRYRSDGVLAFSALWLLGGLRRYRLRTLRHSQEMAHMQAWLDAALAARPGDYALAVEILKCRRLIKGYSDTHARGHSKFSKVIAAIGILETRKDAADWIRRLREAALMDEKGEALDGALATVRSFAS